MELETKRIAELLGCHFNIPAYQRGYRWEERQVSQLLEDLAEYRDTVIKAKRTESKNTCSDYYCLQPVVVVKNDALSESRGHEVYDVIDGQQRLITLYLILNTYERQRKAIFEEKYDDEHNGKTFDIEFERGLGDYLTKRRYIDDDSEWKKDINAFFIKKAYATIDDFDKDRTTKRKRDVIKALLGDEDREDKWITKIIWYDLTGTGESSIEVFKRLNKNKIELTDSELVKALLFECDRFADRELRKKDVLLMSAEWDAMEQELQDDRFWSMLASPDYNPSSRISIVLHKVARDLCRKHSFIGDKNFRDDKFDYYVIEEYLKREDGSGLEDRIGEVWRMMQDTFSVMRNWRDDRETYHLIGFLTSVMAYERKSGSDMDDYIDRLYDAYGKGTKGGFREFLHFEVYETVKVKDDDLNVLRYGEDNDSIFKILLLLNVHTMIERGAESALYPFDKQKKLKISSLEHIHPQNMHDDIKSDRECYEHKVKPWIESKIHRLKNGPKDLKEKVDEDVLQKLEQVIKDDYKGYCDKIEEVRMLISRVDEVFCDYIHLSVEDMHSLRNMALITREDNSALSNLFHDEKREKIKDLCRDKDKYIPLCTRMVFNKEYSNPLNMSFWEKEDREAYYKEIEIVYNFYRTSNKEVL